MFKDTQVRYVHLNIQLSKSELVVDKNYVMNHVFHVESYFYILMFLIKNFIWCSQKCQKVNHS